MLTKDTVMLLRYLPLLAIISAYAASGETPKTFERCFVHKVATIPATSALKTSVMRWHPFSIWKHLHGYVGFIGSTEGQLAKAIADSISTDEADLWQDYCNGTVTFYQLAGTVTAVRMLLYPKHSPTDPPIVIAGSHDFTQQIIAPGALHDAFAAKGLDLLNDRDVKRMEQHARKKAGTQSVPYFVIDHTALREFYRQENATRIQHSEINY
jgi:hypothetical protein